MCIYYTHVQYLLHRSFTLSLDTSLFVQSLMDVPSVDAKLPNHSPNCWVNCQWTHHAWSSFRQGWSDFSGPISVKLSNVRKPTVVKSYICVFEASLLPQKMRKKFFVGHTSFQDLDIFTRISLKKNWSLKLSQKASDLIFTSYVLFFCMYFFLLQFWYFYINLKLIGQSV